MTIPEGTRLGIYEVVAPLGAGGMGEVYRALDTKLQREVAIKVLPEAFAKDKNRLARFEREARILASLSHANIAAIYGLEKSEDILYLVLELVEGETLRERFGAAPRRHESTLKIFYQIAKALEAAHDKGVVHRDLKPENVKVTPEKVVKVLDFGLAKPFESESTRSQISQTPTATFEGTGAGMILGTPAYMSPEQARGQPVDKRTDIWSFGCCLFEALAGRNPFQGATLSDTIAAILETEPDWNVLPKTLPWSVARLLGRCLQKDKHERLHDIADARIEIGEALGLHSSAAAISTIPAPQPKATFPWALVAIVLVLVSGLNFLIWSLSSPTLDAPVRRFATELRATEPLAMESGSAFALSPDGQRLVYVARRGEKTQLFARTLDQLEPSPIPGTEEGSSPFFSPDGNWLGFFSDGKLKKMPLSGGSALTLGESPTARGASWGQGDRIVFSPKMTSGLSLISASGGSPEVLTEPDFDKGEKSHRWPEFLPGGKGVLFTSWTEDGFDIEVVSLESGEPRKLIENGTFARYASTGHIVFVRESALMAVPFSVENLEVTGAEVAVLEGVAMDPFSGAALFAFDRNGLLAYVPGSSESFSSEGTGRLLLVDRQGVAEPVTEMLQREFQLPRLSPDGRRLVVTRGRREDEEDTDLWISELDRGTLTRITFEGSSAAAIWNPNGRQVVFSSNREGPFNLYRKAADGSGQADRISTSDNYQIPTSWSLDGEVVAYTEFDVETGGSEIWLLPMTGEDQARLFPETSFSETSFNEVGAAFSPDGRWIAYVSDETGRNEIYIGSFLDGGKQPVSTGGGTEPVWSPHGRELFYRNEEWIMSVLIETEPALISGKPVPLFEAPYADAGAAYPNFDVTLDGRRFIMIQNQRESAATRLIFIENWFAELESRAPRNPR